DLKAKVAGALAYPIFLAVAGFIVLNILVIFFVPQFKPIFVKLEEKGQLPWLTSALIGVSEFIQGYWMWILGAFIAGVFAFRQWARTDTGRFTLDGWRLRMPGAGKIYLQLAVSRFTRIL